MNKPIRTMSIFCMVLFVALLLNTTWLQYVDAGDCLQDDFTVVRWDVDYSFFLAPAFSRRTWSDPAVLRTKALAHELKLSFQGQNALGTRLIPQQELVAGGLHTVRGYPEVLECYLITGQEADYQLKISVPNMDEYQRFLLTKITRIDGVIGVHSSFVLRKAVDTTALPLGYARA